MSKKSFLGDCHKILAKSPLLVCIAAKLRNQANCVIADSFLENSDPRKNSELWLTRLAAPESSTFVDIGANVGNWAAIFLESAPPAARGILFEPSPSALEKLKSRFGRLKNIEIINAAAGDSSGEMPFFDENGKGESSSLIRKAALSGSEKKKARITTLDFELKKRGWDSVDVLKIDAEGYDLHVLKGASELLKNRKIGLIQFEYGIAWKYAGSTMSCAVDLLDSFGYRVFSLRSNGLFKFDCELYGEYFGRSNYVALSPEKYSRLEKFIKGK